MNRAAFPLRHTQAGLTLIELMIAMVLGALLIGGVGSIVIASGQTNRANQALAQLQENTRTAFELLARDIRQAGVTGCGVLSDRVFVSDDISDPVGGVTDWTGIRGYDHNATAPGVTTGAATGNRVAGTHAILVQAITGTGARLLDVDSDAEYDEFGNVTSEERHYTFPTPDLDIDDGDIVVACNSGGAAVFEASGVSGDDDETTVTDSSGRPYADLPDGMIALLNSTVWYVGNNGRPEEGGRSLYRRRSDGTTEEVVPGITDMQIAYRQGDDANFVASPTDWAEVTAVEVTLTAVSLDDRGGREGGRIERSFTSLIGLRNIRI